MIEHNGNNAGQRAAESACEGGAGRRGIDSFTLKIAAIVGMACNHVANIFAMHLPDALTIALYSLGGLTFPIMAFLLVEGFNHTSNVKKYASRLFLFALISQIPYTLLWGATPNVLFTLLVGLGVLWADRRFKDRPLIAIAWLIVAIVITSPFDWGGMGIAIIFLFGAMRWNRRRALLILLIPAAVIGLSPLFLLIATLTGESSTVLPVAVNTIAEAGTMVQLWGETGYAFIGIGLAGLLLYRYNGKRGKPLKYFFYGFYPAHLLILWIISQLL